MGSPDRERFIPELGTHEPVHSYGRLGRSAIGAIERFFGWLNRHQLITPTQTQVKVNLGSGLYVAPGWINIDGSLKTLLTRCPKFLIRRAYSLLTTTDIASKDEFVRLLKDNLFVHHNLKYGIPLHDESADFVFSSHVLHHLYYWEAFSLLKEAFRVLKPHGVIRVVVPDLEFIISLYQRGQRQAALGYFFYSPSPCSDLSKRHYQYDFVLLREMLVAAGFRNVRRCEFRVGGVPDIALLDRMPEESLYVEAEK
jgi:SAM-dependent methyltransferase